MKRSEKLAKVQELIDGGQLQEARSLMDDIKEADKITAELRELPTDEADEKEESAEDEKEDTETQEEESAEQTEESEENEKEPTEEVEKTEEKGEQRSMEKVILDGKEVVQPEANEVRGFAEFVKSKGEKRAGVTTVEAEAIIPVDVITKARTLPETVVNLRSLVNEIQVSTGSGSYPILAPNKAILTSVTELAKNPELAAPQFTKVNYEVETYRGQIPVSEEALQDSDDNLAAIIANHIQRQGLNTTNAQIAAKLKTATAVPATSLDDLKTLLNVTIEPAYDAKMIVSQSFFNAIDQMKDLDGRYLLQQDITVHSGYRLLGREVVILADDLIGSAKGAKVAFVGDPAAFVTVFKRAETTARWIDNEIYGQLLAIFMRFDVEVVDPAAGYYVTLTPPVVGGE